VAEETAATVIMECSGRCLTLLTTIAASAKAEAIPARTMMAEAAVASVAHILGRTTMRVAGGAKLVTTAATETTWPGTAAIT